ncbi:MAG: hypothetical protein VCD34_01515, partial [Planctomycetota bacterium]
MVVLCLIGFPLLVLGLVAMVYGAGDAGMICLLIGAFPGLIGGMMLHYLKGWFAWASAQRRKSPEQLRQEALDHPFQPEYDNSTDFTEWAKPFKLRRGPAQLHEKYGGGGEEESSHDPGAPWFQGEEEAPPVPPAEADLEDAE